MAALAEIESTFGVLAHALFAKPSLAVNRELPAPVTRVDAVVEVITTARVEPLACERSRVHRRERAHRHAPSHPYMLAYKIITHVLYHMHLTASRAVHTAN